MLTSEQAKKLFAAINDNIRAKDLKEDVELKSQGIESLDTFDFFLRIEEEYGVEVSDDEMVKLNTIKKIVDYVNEHR